MNHIITDDHELGNGWTVYTEYKPVDEDAGIWGWYWAIERDGEDIDRPTERWPYSSAQLRSSGDTDIVPVRDIFGPFRAEDIAKESGILYCNRIKEDPDQWGRLTLGE